MSVATLIVEAMTGVKGVLGESQRSAAFALTPQQQQIVDFAGTVLNVVGVAGSGKTVALVERVAALVASGVCPETILVLSPARESARVLREMLGSRIPVARSGPWARTPQSFAFEVIRGFAADRGNEPPRLMTGGEQEQIIADLLAGHAESGDGPEWPTSMGPEVRALRGFRHELRDVIGQCAESGVDPGDLAAAGRPEWLPVAQFVDEYRKVVTAFEPLPLSAPELVAYVARELSSGTAWPQSVSPISEVLIDDAQELTDSVARLVGQLVRAGARVVSAGDPDTATNEFRGGRPELAAMLGELLDVPSAMMTLESSFRLNGGVAAAMQRLTGGIGAAKAGIQRRALVSRAGDPATAASASVGVYGSTSHLVAGIAAVLRRRHLVDGVPWSDLAVVVRSASAVDGLVRSMEAFGVPVRASGRPELFREQGATEPLITAGALACAVMPPSASTYMHLLSSYLCGMDAIGVRRLRRALRGEEVAGGGNRAADSLLVEAFSAPSGFASLDTPEARVAERTRHRLIDAANARTAEDVLWRLWDSTRVVDPDARLRRVDEVWQEAALSNGSDASALSRNLDAVVALFKTAARYTEQHPDSPPSEFFVEQMTRQIADDIIVPPAAVDATWIGTPAQMLALDFDTVVITGVQDGAWPDLRLRDTLLGAGDVAALAAPRGDVDRRKEVLDSELRMFARALSRARSAAFVAAIDSEEDEPSKLVAVVDPVLRDAPPTPQQPEIHPYTLRGFVGRLRREAVTAPDRETALDAAAALATLAQEGVPGADPRQWLGLVPVSTDQPVYDLTEEHRVPVSPSGIESFETCPLGWFLDKNGGNNVGISTGIGTIVHAAFEHGAEVVDRRRLGEYVDSRWPELEFEATWFQQRERARVDVMLDKLVDYLREAEGRGAVCLAAEVRFEDSGDVYVLKGSIDRIEQNADGTLVLVDLKTGQSLPANAEMSNNPQLGSYQIAIADGLPQPEARLEDSEAEARPRPPIAVGTHVRDALLLGVGTGTRDYVVRRQHPYNDEQIAAFRSRLDAVARAMAGTIFEAHIEQHCLGNNHTQCSIHLIPAVTE